MFADFVANTKENLLQENNQVKKDKENSVEVFNTWNKDIKLLGKRLENQDLMQKEIAMEE